jgi:hypothetical protein
VVSMLWKRLLLSLMLAGLLAVGLIAMRSRDYQPPYPDEATRTRAILECYRTCVMEQYAREGILPHDAAELLILVESRFEYCCGRLADFEKVVRLTDAWGSRFEMLSHVAEGRGEWVTIRSPGADREIDRTSASDDIEIQFPRFDP